MSNNYPAWRFNTEGQSVVVCSPEEDSMLDPTWGTTVPEDFNPIKHPTFPRADLVVKAIDVEAIAEAMVRRKPGPKPKVQ